MLCHHLPFMDLLSVKEAMSGPISGEDRGGIGGINKISLSPSAHNTLDFFRSSLVLYAKSCRYMVRLLTSQEDEV